MSTRVLASHLDQETKFCFDFLSFTRFFPRYYGLGKSQSTSQGCFGGVGPVFLSADLPFYLASYSFRAPDTLSYKRLRYIRSVLAQALNGLLSVTWYYL